MTVLRVATLERADRRRAGCPARQIGDAAHACGCGTTRM
jgi:hypothetical protein